MTIEFLFWVICAVFMGSCAACLTIGYHCGRSDYPPPRRPGPAGEHPYPEGDLFDRAIAEWLAEDQPEHDWGTRPLIPERERLADTGELRRLYERPYPTTAGELRALALNGRADDLAAQVADYKKEIDES